ncbi:sensor histidine kinase [Uliginosibacterium sp. H1]|uniref:sensor histidine kinase n=1 Tax=Uliginosibacterium sp. H1 TaxID=3114757 RepID=UPI002E19F94B|nr:ATP-binding protein [Uliginosibacterium sp. H1]
MNPPVAPSTGADRAVLLVMQRGATVHLNTWWAEFSGLSVCDAKALWQRSAPAEQERLSTVWQLGLDEGHSFQLRFSAIRAADGESRALVLDATPVASADFPDGRWLVTVADTGFDEAGKDVVSAPATACALDVMRIAAWEWNPADGRAWWSQGIYQMLGVPERSGREIDEDFFRYIVPDDIEAVMAGVSRSLATSEELSIRFRIKRADGETRWLATRAAVETGPEGNSPRLVGVNFDVTEQIVVEHKLQSALLQTQEKAQILQAILDHVPEGLAIALGPDKQIVAVSRHGQKMIEGSTPADSRAWDAWGVYHLDGVTRAAPEEMALHRACDGAVIIDEEWLLRAANGALIHVSSNAAPILNAEGKPIGGLVSWVDISHRKRAETERRHLLESETAARAAAEEANRMKDLFLAMLSHELRNPMSAILGWGQILQTGKAGPDMRERAADVIIRNAMTLKHLVDDLLDVSRIMAGKLEIQPVETDLTGCVEAALETMKPMADAKQIALVQSDRTSLPAVADPHRMQQVVWNLLSNAVKFSPRDSRVEITAQRIGVVAVIEVADNGPGIPDSLLPHIFERFHQGDDPLVRSQGGLGLGLSIARHIVEAHQGSIEVRNRAGGGASFSVRLPLRG